LCRNQETRERTTEATIAVKKFEIIKPGTIKLTRYKRATFINMADIPKVKIDIGRAIT